MAIQIYGEIEKLLKLSEAELDKEVKAKISEKRNFWKGRISGLRAALRIIERGNNA